MTDYTALQAAIASWIHRTDLGAVIPDFIRLVEEKLNRYLRTKDNEVALGATAITANRISLPPNMVGIKSLWLDGYEAAPLKPQSIESVTANGTDGLATMYAQQGSELVFDGTGTVEGVLYRSIPALGASTATNWVLTAHPSVYLFGALAEAHLYTMNQQEAAVWSGRFQAALDEINGNSQRDTMGGPLVARAR